MHLFALLACATTPPPIASAPPAPSAAPEPPRLVVAVVIDQLRADYLTRFEDTYLPPEGDEGVGGFRYLMERGAWYPFGEHRVYQAMTGPGHATVLTGAWPARTGIASNGWYDEAHVGTYCVADPEHGISPRNLRAPTLGDAIKSSGWDARVVSIAHKDRAAVLMGGYRADVAMWWDREEAAWTSSSFYDPLPDWVSGLALDDEPLTWAEAGPGNGRSEEGDAGFSESMTPGDGPWRSSPFAMTHTVDAAIAALEAEALGADAAPDVLAVSLSAFDKLGHALGPNHRKMEAMAVAADAELARLLRAVDASVGLDRALVVLTGDHGAPSAPDYLAPEGVPSEYLDEEAIEVGLEEALTAAFGPGPAEGWVTGSVKLNVYLRHEDQSLDEQAAMERAAAAWLAEQPGVVGAWAAADVRAGRLPPGILGEGIANQYVQHRSGDVLGAAQAFHMPGDPNNPSSDRVRHFTHYTYDRMVPIVFAGPGILPGRYAEPAAVVDIAPTLSYLLGVLPPAVSEGRVLSEALE